MASWTSAGGAGFNFDVGTAHSDWLQVPGVYLFVRNSGAGAEVLYAGKTENLKDRLCAAHHKWSAAHRMGMTHILAMLVRNAYERDARERILIQEFRPPLNDLLLPAAALGFGGLAFS